MRIDLILSGTSQLPEWRHGSAWLTEGSLLSLAERWSRVASEDRSVAFLCWDATLGPPPEARLLARLLEGPGDVWHGGLRLGLSGLPKALSYVAPTWMHGLDPDAAREGTSWRLSFRAALFRRSAGLSLGGPDAGFDSIAAAGLELGHRYLRGGAVVLHQPDLIASDVEEQPARLSVRDEIRWVQRRYGRRWALWALLRGVLAGRYPLTTIRTELPAVRGGTAAISGTQIFRSDSLTPAEAFRPSRVTVLIPTLDRYAHLHTVLEQLRAQTVAPAEVLVIDQTSAERRQPVRIGDSSELPMRVFVLDRAGQCSSRNYGLERSTGDYILFLDDDDEVSPDLIERHLRVLERKGIDASSGVAEEVGAGSLPADFTYTRVSDVFPTNNTMVARKALERAGLFDLAYDRGQRADGDLGMRIHRSGALMVLSPDISVVHHHAPTGGMRSHGARVVTYARSRRSLWHRSLPTPSDFYLANRYFSKVAAAEVGWQGVLGTFRIRGGWLRTVLKILIALVQLPDTLWRSHRSAEAARELGHRFPQIPRLGTPGEDEEGG